MAAWKTYSFRSKSEMDDFLNGLVLSPVDIAGGLDLDGLTLVVDVGGGDKTVTFAPALGTLWTPDEIQAKIEATAGLEGVAKLEKVIVEAGLPTKVYLKLTSSGGVKVDLTGTSNPDFGWSAVADTVGHHFTATEVIDTHTQWGGKWEWHVVTLV